MRGAMYPDCYVRYLEPEVVSLLADERQMVRAAAREAVERECLVGCAQFQRSTYKAVPKLGNRRHVLLEGRA